MFNMSAAVLRQDAFSTQRALKSTNTPKRGFIAGSKFVRSMAFLVVVVCAGVAPGAVITFDNASDLSLFNQVQNGGSGGAYSHGATSGLAGGGGVTTSTGSFTTAVYTGESFDFSQPGTTLTASMFVRRTATTPTDFRHLLNLGFTSDTTTDLRLAGPFMGIRALVVANMTTGYLQTVNSTTNGTSSVGNQSPGGQGTSPGTGWFKLTATFVNAGGGNVTYSGTLDSYGADGDAFVSNVWTRSPINIANVPMTSDTSVYAAFRAEGGTASAVALDTFTVIVPVPEPAAMSALALGAAAFLGRRRQA